jgi:hypothetical protein
VRWGFGEGGDGWREKQDLLHNSMSGCLFDRLISFTARRSGTLSPTRLSQSANDRNWLSD